MTMIDTFNNGSANYTSSSSATYEDYEGVNFPVFNFGNVCPNNITVWPLLFLTDEAITEMGLLYNMGQYLLVNYLIPFIIVGGILGNGLFLLTLARIREMRTITAFYLANLAISDLAFLISVGIRTFTGIAKSPYMYIDPFRSSIGCALSRTITYTSYFGSIWFVTLVTFERYVSICHPVKHRLIKGQRRTMKLVLATWTVALILGVGLGIGNLTELTKFCIIWPLRPLYKDLPSIVTFCSTTSRSLSSSAYLLQTSAFATAVILNAGMYWRIIHKIGTNRVVPNEVSAGAETTERPAPGMKNAKRLQNSVTKMLITTGVIFFVCLTPWQFNICQTAISLLSGSEVLTVNTGRILIFVGTTFNSLNSSINPLIYGVTNPRYRKAFQRALSCDNKAGDNRDLASITATKTTAPVIHRDER